MKKNLVLTAALVIGTAAPASAEMLKGQQISEMFTGARVYAKTDQGLDIQINYSVGGAMNGTGMTKGGTRFSDTGRWWVDGDRFCRQWSRWRDGVQECYTLEVRDGRLYWLKDGGKVADTTSVPAK